MIPNDDTHDWLLDEEGHDKDYKPKPGLAFALSFLAPGLGYVYAGKVEKAFFIHTLYALLFVVAFLAWAVLKFFPPIPFAFLFLVYSVSVFRHAYYAYQCAEEADGFMRPNILTLLSIGSFSFWLPILFTLVLSQHLIFQTVQTNSDGMLPNVRRGDVLLVDRSAYLTSVPQHGDLVMVEEQNPKTRARRLFFARVIAVPKDTIQMMDTVPVVNGQPLSQDRVISKQFENLLYEVPHSHHKKGDDAPTTEEPEQWYPILSAVPILVSKTETYTLDDGQYYVLEDNRVSHTDTQVQRMGVIVHASWIKGRPLYVFYNAYAKDKFEPFGVKLR